ncbi:endo-1,3;1,4-beta-D-glucanase-like [Aristolochia californica]|uniref:endo-1,3;1,4-beta-D-glucanase-like n=1 Tax=Aristolochia californica TaxID=171875 RepID=UPI0035D7636B
MAGARCCENPPSLSSASGSGSVVAIGGLSAYVAGSPDSKAAVLFVTDVYGYEAPNLRELADRVGAAGFYAVVPDFLHGDPFGPEKHSSIQDWLKLHAPDKAAEEAKTVVAAIKSKGISSIGTVGICWGAKVIVELAKTNEIQAAVMFHPSFVTLDDIKEVKCHISILGAEIDKLTPPELAKQFEEALSAKSEIDSFVKIFPGAAHGWTVRYNPNDELSVKKAEEAHGDMLAWFTKHLN